MKDTLNVTEALGVYIKILKAINIIIDMPKLELPSLFLETEKMLIIFMIFNYKGIKITWNENRLHNNIITGPTSTTRCNTATAKQ